MITLEAHANTNETNLWGPLILDSPFRSATDASTTRIDQIEILISSTIIAAGRPRRCHPLSAALHIPTTFSPTGRGDDESIAVWWGCKEGEVMESRRPTIQVPQQLRRHLRSQSQERSGTGRYHRTTKYPFRFELSVLLHNLHSTPA